jgi:hypothetical protein
VAVLLNPPDTRWVCANGCGVIDVTPARVPNRFHVCKALAGVLAPLVPIGSGARVVVVDREDFVGKEDVPVDGNGRPVMAVRTERPDGSNDVMMFAPTARGSSEV